MHTDLLATLDTWIYEGKAPEKLTAIDRNDQVNHRTRPIYEYPYYPAYNGTGDINNADNFHPEKMGEIPV